MAEDLKAYLQARRGLVDRHLGDCCSPDGCPSELTQAMRYSLLAPGKRLRPLLVILAADACGGSDRQALPAAAAVEMIHTYSLIHDDLPAMDDDDLRRGLPTCHKKFGEATAILAGDALLTMAFQVLAEGYPPKTAAACCRELARGAGACGMVGGQMEDLAWEKAGGSGSQAGLKDLENIHDRKTGALFRASLQLGAWAALGEQNDGPGHEVLDALDSYGRAFGQAFQITDDLLDVEGDPVLTGKRVQKDAARGKLTYPGLLGVNESRRRAKDLCTEAVSSLQRFGPKAERLAALCDFVLSRDR